MIKRKPQVLLISMPWTSLTEPSLGLSILKSELENNDVECRIRHANIFLLEHLTESTYHDIANVYAINDFIFTNVFEPNINKEHAVILKKNISEILKNNHFVHNKKYDSPEKLFNLLLHIRNKIIPRYLQGCLQFVKEFNPTMVGFTCMYDQTFASLALAKLIHEWNSQILISFGGYSIYGEIGKQLMKSFDFIDCVAYGAGEVNIVDIALSSVKEKRLEDIPNICYRSRQNNQLFDKSYCNNNDINDMPIPDFTDFNADISELSSKHLVNVTWNAVPIATSTGCWWGEKSHCVFCGINEKYIRYKCKDANKVISKIFALNKKYHKTVFRFYDYILSNKYYETVLPYIGLKNKKSKNPFSFTGEIKSNIKEKQFKALKDAGFLMVQPGIESFSTNVLKKMRKGVRGIQNIYCLLLGIKYNVYIGYNVLYGFPDDSICDYEQLAKTIPFLYHLNYPNSYTRIAITKDSPIYGNADMYGIKRYEHHSLYDCILSTDFMKNINFNLDYYCYYYQYPFELSIGLKFQYKIIQRQITYWTQSQNSREVVLYYETDENGITFFDSRYSNTIKSFSYGKIVADVYSFCECSLVKTNDVLLKFKYIYSTNDLLLAEEVLIGGRFVYKEGNTLLGLALHKSIYDRNKSENKARNKKVENHGNS